MIVRFCTISRVPKNGEMKGVGPIYIFACPTQAVLIKAKFIFWVGAEANLNFALLTIKVNPSSLFDSNSIHVFFYINISKYIYNN